MSFDSVINWFTTNIPFIIVLIVFVIFLVRALKNGFVKELCEFVSAIIASIAILLLAFAIHGVFDKDKIQFVVAVVLIVLLGIIYKLLSLFFTSLKLVSKIPVVKVLDKILGVVMAVLEIVVLLWAVYCLIIIVNGGALGRWIIDCVKVNPVMRFVYEYNYMYQIVASISSKLRAEDLLSYIDE